MTERDSQTKIMESWSLVAWLQAGERPPVGRALEENEDERKARTARVEKEQLVLIDVVRAVRQRSDLWRLGPIDAMSLLPPAATD
jgi:hypothetical protein